MTVKKDDSKAKRARERLRKARRNGSSPEQKPGGRAPLSSSARLLDETRYEEEKQRYLAEREISRRRIRLLFLTAIAVTALLLLFALLLGL